MKRRYFVYMFFIFAFGCSENDSNANKAQVEESVFDTQTEAIDKAEALEQQILDAAAKQRQVLEESGG